MSDGSDDLVGLTPFARVFPFPWKPMEETGKSKTGEAGRKVRIARGDARAAQLAPIVAEVPRIPYPAAGHGWNGWGMRKLRLRRLDRRSAERKAVGVVLRTWPSRRRVPRSTSSSGATG